jgi:hypothetical protein
VLGALGAVAIILGLGGLGGARWWLAFGWLISPFALVPWLPWPLRFRIGPPITPSPDVGGTRDRVEAAVQALVSEPSP